MKSAFTRDLLHYWISWCQLHAVLCVEEKR